MLKGLTVLDLGCGAGRDVYLAAQLVGENGTAIGVDMTGKCQGNTDGRVAASSGKILWLSSVHREIALAPDGVLWVTFMDGMLFLSVHAFACEYGFIAASCCVLSCAVS